MSSGERVSKAPEESLPRKFSVRSAMAVWIQEIAAHGIFTTDDALLITSWNDWLVAHSGRAVGEVLGRSLTEVFPDLTGRHLAERYTKALTGEVSVISNALHRFLLAFPTTVANAPMPHMLQTARIAPLREGSTVIGTITVIEDVTEREIHTNILRRQQEVDRLLSAALAMLLQSDSPAQEIAGIFATISPVLGLDSYVSYLLSSDRQVLHLVAAGGILPKLREELLVLPLAEKDREALKDKSVPAELNVASHLDLLRRAGLRNSWSFPLLVGDRLIGLVAFASYETRALPPEDVGVLDRIARYFSIALDRSIRERDTLAASHAKDDFLAALSHELRTPLNPVLLVASDGAANSEFPAAAREAFRVIEKNSMLEARLIDDLLDLTRIEHGKLSLQKQPVDIHAVISDALRTVQPDVASQGLRVHANLGAVKHRVGGDPARLQQVFWNIVKNAVKFTPKGGEIFVSTTVSAAENEIVVTIRDTGIGLEPGEVERIFEAFKQGDHAISGRSHVFGGLGLGLAISRKLVMLHGGCIAASSEGRNRGAAFAIHLPLTEDQEEAAARAAPSLKPDAAGPRAASHQDGMRLLLVEDHEATRTTLQSLLRRRGYAVTAVDSAKKALQEAAKHPFDLVLSDIGLPGDDGFTLMRALRDRHGLKGIALTGYGMEGDLAKSKAAGFIDHLTKPVSVTMLERSLAAAFSGSGEP